LRILLLFAGTHVAQVERGGDMGVRQRDTVDVGGWRRSSWWLGGDFAGRPGRQEARNPQCGCYPSPTPKKKKHKICANI